MQAPALDSALLRKFVAIVGEKHVLTDPVDLSVYDCDAETIDVARPDVVILPASTEEVAAVVRLAFENKIPVAPRGAGTGLSGGATALHGGILLSMSRMTKIFAVDNTDRVAHVQVGVTNVAVSNAARPLGLYFAPDPSSQSASSIGGNVAENAGGPHCLKYGMTTKHVLGLKVVLADGTITTFGGRARDRQGLDLLGVFVGSEGTLGIATEAYLNLIPIAQAVETMLVYFSSIESAGRTVSAIVASGVVPAAMEMIDRVTLNAVEDFYHMGLNREAEALLIVELDGPRTGIAAQRKVVEACMTDGQIMSVQWAENSDERGKIWKARKMAFGAYGRIAPHVYVLDGVIPRSKLADSIREIALIAKKHDLVIANVYHAGDGNLHPCILFFKDNEEEVRRTILAGQEILHLCVKLGGTLSGEHGIGIEKLLEMPVVFSEDDMEAMNWVKESFDETRNLNPGKAIPMPKSCGESGKGSLLRFRILTGC